MRLADLLDRLHDIDGPAAAQVRHQLSAAHDRRPARRRSATCPRSRPTCTCRPRAARTRMLRADEARLHGRGVPRDARADPRDDRRRRPSPATSSSASAARRRRISSRRSSWSREARFKNSFIFKYSPRPGTKAAELYADDVPEDGQAAAQQRAAGRSRTRSARKTTSRCSAARSRSSSKGPASRAASTPRRRPQATQLVGRTPCDRIVVFDGPGGLDRPSRAGPDSADERIYAVWRSEIGRDHGSGDRTRERRKESMSPSIPPSAAEVASHPWNWYALFVMKNNPLPRLDTSLEWRGRLLPHCRLKPGEIWQDPKGNHRVGCVDATDVDAVTARAGASPPHFGNPDPPDNVAASRDEALRSTSIGRDDGFALPTPCSPRMCPGKRPARCGPERRLSATRRFHGDDVSGPFAPRSFITSNQRGYGTQKNWMAVRQELLYYTKGTPVFNVEAEYTDIPKILRGYYKEVNGVVTENLETQQVRQDPCGKCMGGYPAGLLSDGGERIRLLREKPLKSVMRIVRASSKKNSTVLDLFAHSGSTLLAAEILGRSCLTADIDPVFCEITIRRLEQYRKTGKLGWQNSHPFEKEVSGSVTNGELVASREGRERPSERTLF